MSPHHLNKELKLELYHSYKQRQMLAQLPLEVIDLIITRLSFKALHALAHVCSALRLPAQLRLFKTIRILTYMDQLTPHHTRLILSYPHLLQYASRLIVTQSFYAREQAAMPIIPARSFWSYLPTMYRLTHIQLDIEPVNHPTLLPMLEGLGPAREIKVDFMRIMTHGVRISQDPLPVYSLTIPVGASGDRVTRLLLHKCSQSLRALHLYIRGVRVFSIPLLPHLREFSLHSGHRGDDQDLTPWLPFLLQHPSITCISLDPRYSLAAPIPPSLLPNLLPNLRSLEAQPALIGQLVPGRSVHNVRTKSLSTTPTPSLFDLMFQSLQLSHVPLTFLEIKTGAFLASNSVTDMIQTLPNLRKFTLAARYELPLALRGLLSALGKCKDMLHIRLSLRANPRLSDTREPLWSRADFVDMIQIIQESGASNLCSFVLEGHLVGRDEGCQAVRVGWLDVAWQPRIKGEWRIDERSTNILVP